MRLATYNFRHPELVSGSTHYFKIIFTKSLKPNAYGFLPEFIPYLIRDRNDNPVLSGLSTRQPFHTYNVAEASAFAERTLKNSTAILYSVVREIHDTNIKSLP